MTLDQIDKLEAGNQVDVLIQEMIFQTFVRPPPNEHGTCLSIAYTMDYDEVPPYSTSIEAAWRVVEKMLNHGGKMYQIEMKGYADGFIVKFHENPPVDWCLSKYWDANNDKDASKGDTAPLAICKAALKVVISKS